MFVTRKVFLKYQSPETGGEGGSGGGSSGDGGEGGSGEGGEGKKPAAGEDEGGEGKKPAAGEGEGQKKPSDEEARLLKENMRRKEELRKKDEELTNLKKSIEGIDLDSVRQMLADKKAAEEKALEAKGDFDNLKKRMAEEHAKEVQLLRDQLAGKEAELNKLVGNINELTVGGQFANSKLIAEELVYTPNKARAFYGDHFDLVDGKVVGFDKPRGAQNRTALVDQYGEPVAFDDALRKIVEADPEKDYVFKSKVKPGAGSESKRPSTPAGGKDAPSDALSKIQAGLKGVKFPV